MFIEASGLPRPGAMPSGLVRRDRLALIFWFFFIKEKERARLLTAKTLIET
jgi:hypothetical protein